MHFTLKQLRYVEAAARCGSIVMASEELNISQSSIAFAIDSLEVQLGMVILTRQPAKGVALTAVGETIIERIRDILDKIELFDDEVSNLSNLLKGELRLGYYSTFSPWVLPKVIRVFNEIDPEISIRLLEAGGSLITEMLLNDRLDIALMYGTELSTKFEFVPLFMTPLCAVFPATHALANKKSVPLEAVAKEPLILVDYPEANTYFRNLFSLHDITPNIVHRTTNYELVCAMVSAELGTSILSIQSKHEHTYEGVGISRVPITHNAPLTSVGFVFLKDHKHSDLIRKLVNNCTLKGSEFDSTTGS